MVQIISKRKYNLPDSNSFLGWEIKVDRITPESETNDVKDAAVVDSITETY